MVVEVTVVMNVARPGSRSFRHDIPPLSLELVFEPNPCPSPQQPRLAVRMPSFPLAGFQVAHRRLLLFVEQSAGAL